MLRDSDQLNGHLGCPAETKSGWREKLAKLSDDGLYKHCEKYIWLSAYANNNPQSDYHFLADAGYDECKRREKIEIYQRAYDYHTK